MSLEELKRRARELADAENWVNWPNGAQLQDLPVGSRIEYRKAHYERTENGLRCYWSGTNTVLTGRNFALDDGWTDPHCVRLPPGYHFSGSEVVKEETVATPASLAGAVGLEKYANEAYAQAIQGQWIQAKPSDGLANGYVFRQGDYQQQVQPVQPKPPTCSCGSTHNIRVSLSASAPLYECGSCAQTRRRVELQSKKLEQTKRDMDRPVKRDPLEWLGFSSASWEE